MIQDPFKLHPLPPGRDDDWGEGSDLDFDEDSDELAPARTPSPERETLCAEELIAHHLTCASLEARVPALPYFEGLRSARPPLPADLSRELLELYQLRAHLRIELAYSDAGADEAQARTETVLLRSLPLLLGRDASLAQLQFSDPEVPSLRGYLYQIGGHLIYRDLGAAGGTLLERTIGGKIQLLGLKGEPCPLVVGDRLVLGGVDSALQIKSIYTEARETPYRAVDGLAPSLEALQAAVEAGSEIEHDPPPDADTAPMQGPSPLATQPYSYTGLDGITNTAPVLPILLGLCLVVGGLILGRLTAPELPSPQAQLTPLPTRAEAPSPEVVQLGPNLELIGGERFRLISPPMKAGSYLFLLTGAEPEQPDPYGQGSAYALAQVNGDGGEVSLVYAPAGVARALLAASPVLQADALDPRLRMFQALGALQLGQVKQATEVLHKLALETDAPLTAIKARAMLALDQGNLELADSMLQRGMERNASDPELHFLRGRVYALQGLRLPEDNLQRAILLDDARVSLEESIRLWLLPPASAVSYRGHELGLSGEALLDEYLRLLPRLTQLRAETENARSLAASSSSTPNPGLGKGPALISERDAVPFKPPSTPTERSGGHMLIRVPGGDFLMGGDESAPSDEQGIDGRVTLKTFYLDTYEVSNRQFERVFPDHQARRGPSTGDNDPVVQVTWDEALRYCQTVGLRLPTEAEWEHAARGSDGRTYPWGSEEPRPSLMNTRDSRINRPTPVDSYPEGNSPYGHYNMAGNVWEWTADWYDPTYYRSAPRRNPTGPAEGTRKIIRGGSYQDGSSDARASNRASTPPSVGTPKLGFRCARDG